MIRCLHIVPNEKYISCAIAFWDNLPAVCRFVCIDSLNEPFYKSFEDRVEFISRETLIEILHSDSYDVVVFSSFPFEKYSLVLEIPDNRIVIWQSVGYDIYSNDYPYKAVVPMELYKPITEAQCCPRKSDWQNIRHIGRWIISPMFSFKKWQSYNRTKKECINFQRKVWNKINYISSVLPSEYDLIKQNPYLNARFFHFQYVLPTTDVRDEFTIDTVNSKYILLGNSGDETNNHLDVLETMRRHNITNPIYASIAYGGEPKYVSHVISELKKNPENIVQTDFMPREDYIKILHQCRVAVFGHLRQQALGNIGLALRQGCKVYLYKDSVTYKYYKSIGLHIYSIEDDLTQDNIDEPLTQEEIFHNRSFFAKLYDDVLQSTIADFKEIEQLYMERKSLC